MLRVHQCCCGVNLRTGTLMIAAFWTISALIRIIIFSIFAEKIHGLTPEIMENQTYLNGLRGMFIVIIVTSAVEFLVGICLSYGTIMDRTRFIFTWIAANKVFIPINFVTYFFVAIIYFVATLPGQGAGVLIYGLINLLLTAYCFVVVNSHYRDLGFTQYP